MSAPPVACVTLSSSTSTRFCSSRYEIKEAPPSIRIFSPNSWRAFVKASLGSKSHTCAAGKEDTSGVDCTDERFKDYPICTGLKPQAVIDYEKSQEVTKLNLEKLNQESVTAIAEPEVEKIVGTVEVKNQNAKKTSFLIDLEASGVKVEVIASKKGSKTIKRTVTTNAEGEKLVAFGKNLKGYTIKILVDGEVINRVKL